jgi:small GTP-binding protein
MEEFVRKICICGDPSVGKTSLIRRFVVGHFNEKYISTLGTVVSKKNITISEKDTEVKLLIWDISGQTEFKHIHASAFRDATGAIIVCDVTRPKTAENTYTWVSKLFEYAGKEIPIIILTNKMDLIKHNMDLINNVKAILGSQDCPVYPTSAKTGLNIEMVFQKLAEAIMNKGKMALKPDIQLVTQLDSFDGPSSLLDYIMIRFSEAMDDQEFAMHILRKQISDEGIDFQDLQLDDARRLINRLAKLYSGFKGDEAARWLKMDLMKAFWQLNNNKNIDPFS